MHEWWACWSGARGLSSPAHLSGAACPATAPTAARGTGASYSTRAASAHSAIPYSTACSTARPWRATSFLFSDFTCSVWKRPIKHQCKTAILEKLHSGTIYFLRTSMTNILECVDFGKVLWNLCHTCTSRKHRDFYPGYKCPLITTFNLHFFVTSAKHLFLCSEQECFLALKITLDMYLLWKLALILGFVSFVTWMTVQSLMNGL